jgi:hypothetical protein
MPRGACLYKNKPFGYRKDERYHAQKAEDTTTDTSNIHQHSQADNSEHR